jgi:predicted phosphodiesterase
VPDPGLTDAPTRLLHLSDLHFGSEDEEALRAVAEFAARIKPEAILVSGDITQRGRRREFAAARQWFDSLGVQTIVAAGNHDTPLLHIGARLSSPFERYERYMRGIDATGQLVELAGGAIRISAINTARGVQMRRNWAEGSIRPKDLDTALGQLEGGPKDAWRLLLCHHPLVEPELARIRVTTQRGTESLHRAAGAGVHAILTGHTHDAFVQLVESPDHTLVQMGAGTLSTRLRGSDPGFCVLSIWPNRLVQEVVHIEKAALRIDRNYDSAAAATAS